MPTAKNLFQILNLHPKKHMLKKKRENMVLNQKITPIFPNFFRFRRFFRFFQRFFLTICLILGFSPPPPLKPPIPHGSPVVVFYKKWGKIGFSMPTAKNRFQILNLHPKKHVFKKKHPKKNMVLKENLSSLSFRTPKIVRKIIRI